MKKDQSHITHKILAGKDKAKNPTIFYYVYIMDHETITYKAPIQELSVYELIVSHCHTKIDKFLSQFVVSRQPASTVQSLLCNPHGYIQCVCGCMCATDNFTTDSQLSLSPISQLGLHWI